MEWLSWPVKLFICAVVVMPFAGFLANAFISVHEKNPKSNAGWLAYMFSLIWIISLAAIPASIVWWIIAY